ncbi:MAG: hypothetical protein E7164_00665 [Firmicutes bacterium]|nr:hypothetical protein [Bacillota bacterium]
MKKILLIIVAIGIFLMPFSAYAIGAGEGYVYSNFEQTLAEEGIEKAYDSYKENDKQAIIYLFRGKGCSFCKAFLTYLNSITDEYGKYFKLVSYEVWQNTDNKSLMNDVAKFLDEPAGGVPYIVIGDQVFVGYTQQYNESIQKAIKDLYDSEEKYDVFVEMAKPKDEGSSSSNTAVIIWNVLTLTLATIIILVTINVKDKKVHNRLNELEKIISVQEKNNKKLKSES